MGSSTKATGCASSIYGGGPPPGGRVGGLVFESGCDVSEAKRLVATLPIVEAGLLDFEVIPLRPYIGIRELFENPT